MKETSVSFGNLAAMSMAYAALKYNDMTVYISKFNSRKLQRGTVITGRSKYYVHCSAHAFSTIRIIITCILMKMFLFS